MHISIIGAARSGKSTLFQALRGQGQPSQGRADMASAVIDVPDERLDTLAAIYKPRKTTYARITINDTATDSRVLTELRLSDAFLLVLRDFDNGEPADPVTDYLAVINEFILSDLGQVETRLERIKKQGVKGNAQLAQEASALEECLSHLGDGRPLSTLDLFQRDGKSLRGFQFLSLTPVMVLLNLSEAALTGSSSALQEIAGRLPSGVPLVAACASLEAELALMPATEQGGYMEEYGITESLRGRIIRLAMDTLGLISFFTVGEDECRAWPIRRGSTAQEGAGAIHSDLAARFIRAETVSYQDFMAHGGIGGCKKTGLWRLEGKTYVLQDGDILTIRAGN